MGREIFKKSTLWVILGLVILLIVGFWFYNEQQDEGIIFSPGNLVDKTTAPVVEEKMNRVQDKNLVKKLQAPISLDDSLSTEESERFIKATTAPIPGVK